MTKTQLQKEWEDRIAAYQASGLSVREWCAAHGVKPNRLWYWLRRNKNQAASPVKTSKTPQWLPVEVSEQMPGNQNNAVLIRIGQASVEVNPGFDPAMLSEIIHILVAVC